MTDRADRDVILRGIAAIARNVLAIVHELRQNDKDRDALALAEKAYTARRTPRPQPASTYDLARLANKARDARLNYDAALLNEARETSTTLEATRRKWETRAPRHSQR